MSVETPLPTAIAQGISRRVVGQDEAVREVSIALAKRLAGLRTGNVLMIGASGTGKTTLMRAVEEYLGADEALAAQTMLIRVHANVLAEHAEEGKAGEVLLRRLLDKAREDLGQEVGVDTLLERVGRGIVFVDEVDKIRASVGDQPNVPGIRAQESLLTLIENEAIPFSLPDWAGGNTVTFDASHLLFVCAGAFEGLYDAVYDRITVGRDRGALQGVSVMEGGQVHHEMRFSLRDWMRYEDLFDYGMTPQFLSRFDAHVLLNDLGEQELVDIFLNSPESGYHQTRAYFEAVGVQLAISPAAVRRIAREAGKQPRLGARALKEVFRRVVRDYEFAPREAARDGTLMIDLPEVDSALGD
jgi:ATP-dependent Clp protease ATP-binding subunit ClpX